MIMQDAKDESGGLPKNEWAAGKRRFAPKDFPVARPFR